MATAVLLFGGGSETTANLVSTGAHLLLGRPDVVERLRRDPAGYADAVEEILRFEGAFHATWYVVLEPTSLGGQDLEPGEWVAPLLAAANRDPAEHPDPDRFDVDRRPNHHLAFSAGAHHCLGATLARVETEIACASCSAASAPSPGARGHRCGRPSPSDGSISCPGASRDEPRGQAHVDGRTSTIRTVIAAIVDARDGWLAATPAQRAEIGPDVVATCAEAIASLAGRLVDLGYPVSTPIERCGDLDGALAGFHDTSVVVPPALVSVWRTIGTVCLVDLDRYRHVAFWDRILDAWRAGAPDDRGGGPIPCCDGLVIDGPSQDGWVDYVIDMIEDGAEQGLPPAIELGPDDLHKDGVSGSGPYELLLPDPGTDPWLTAVDGFRWPTLRPASAPPDPPDLVSYLRTAILECGGFPGLYGHPAFAPVLERLRADLPVF